MHWLISLLIVACTTFQYLVKEHGAPSLLQYAPEVLSLVVTGYVVLVGARTGFGNVRFGYWIAFVAILVVILSGIVMNGVATGPLFAGIRTYLRALPMFFLPAVLEIDDRKLKRQLLLVLTLSFVQAPLAVLQRTTSQAEGHRTGDLTIGTLMSSGTLTVFLICVACVLAGMYLRKRMSLTVFIPVVLIVLIPTTVNETKATMVLLPIGLLTTFIAGARPGRRVGNTLKALLVLSVFGSIFLPVYDYYARQRWGYGLVTFLTMQGRVENYMEKRGAGVGNPQAGRVDAVMVPLRELARDPPELALGLGIGNASESALGEQFTGVYYRRFEPFSISTAAVLLLETGVFGLGLVFVLYWMIFRDARFVSDRRDGLRGALASGWTGVVAVLSISTFYQEMMAHVSLSFLFWYLSGIVAADRVRLMQHVAQKRVPSPLRVEHAMPVRTIGQALRREARDLSR